MSAKRKTGPKENYVPIKVEVENEDYFRELNGDVRQQENISPVRDDDLHLWPNFILNGKKATSTNIIGNSNMSPSGQETASNHDETSSSGQKEDDDEDEDDEDILKTASHIDIDRVKAFNMFVKSFVDENLDRIVPISKQPKDTVQAILDACVRQFPDLADRSRKRVRTYLKSCRRNKRTRDASTWTEASRPTPAHLTSARAEQILAQACENEREINAKKMRLGVEPTTSSVISVSNPMIIECIKQADPIPSSSPSRPSFSIDSLNLSNSGVTPAELKQELFTPNFVFPLKDNSEYIRFIKSIPQGAHIGGTSIAADKPTTSSLINSSTSSSGGTSVETTKSLNGSMNNNSNFRPNLRNCFPPGSSQNIFSTAASNGPTDLSMKTNIRQPLKRIKQLSSQELKVLQQLILGYRESAAFLLRSADELESLLHTQLSEQKSGV